MSNTTLSGWINDGNAIGMDAERQQVLMDVLGLSAYDVVRLWGGLDLTGGTTVGDSPRPAQSQIDTTQVADIRQARSWSAEVLPLRTGEDAA